MTFKSFGAGLVLAVAVTGFSNPSQAQNFISLMGSADATTAPLYPGTVPNNAVPLANIQAITGFDRTFGYGSSSTNTRRADTSLNQVPPSVFTEVNSNGHAIYIELFSPLVGAINGRGSSFPPATNLADGGSTSVTALTGSPAGCTLNTAPAGQTPNGTCTQQPQIQEFQQIFGRYRPGDIVVQWSGINDWNTNNINTQATVNNIINQDVTNQLEMVRQNIALGAKNYVFVGLADLGTFANFTTLKPTNDPALITQGSLATNAGNLAGLITLHQQNPGVNIHYFDSNLFVSEIRANPTAYGFTPQGVAVNAYGIGTFGSAAAYDAQPFNVQNQFLTPDGLHWTYRYHEWLAMAIANQLLAPFSVAAQAEFSQNAGTNFSGSLLRRLDDYRGNSLLMSDLVAADLPVKAPPSAPGTRSYGPISVYVEGVGASTSSPDRLGAAGQSYRSAGVLAGAEYSWTRDFLFGIALGWSHPHSDLNDGFGSVEGDSFQVGGYANISFGNFYFETVAAGAFNNLNVTRPGLVGNLTASTNSQTFVSDSKLGYLWDITAISGLHMNAASLRAGPVGGLTYSHVHVNGYTESGDPILNQAVNSQDLDGLTGRAGIEFRYPFLLNAFVMNSWLDVTADRDFLTGARTITTAQTYALPLTIATPTSEPVQTYGRVAGGVSAQIWHNVALNLNGETTFARQGGNEYALSGGIKIVW